ncbi:hypothetical protein CkaCkLH20_04192 [Colletotrichum karsti]|uniref:SNF2 N-terminal domain-containing protein n=1 Tax=Colletotrichum karsti TaxID=1095194 RepID=A0A9P6I8Y6_9PEZI|nr:uncharacterized protein CkaCkLH20_04192 [Colletotrichum karsti]KAF9878154.1 hypothetical protein CkaCkLH20_04192 [Colletotrichum karsti]
MTNPSVVYPPPYEDAELQERRPSCSNLPPVDLDHLQNLGLDMDEIRENEDMQYCLRKMDAMMQRDYKGCIASEDLGFDIDTLVASLARHPGQPYQGPIVLVSADDLTSFMDNEAKRPFKGDFKPRILRLGDKRRSAKDLIRERWDFIIVTRSFLRSSFRRHYLHHNKTSGARPKSESALYSKTWREEGLSIRALVIDEAQVFANKMSTLKDEAIKELDCDTVILSMTAPLPNNIKDLFGLVFLLPGNPFHNYKTFKQAFQVGAELPRGLADDYQQLMKRFLNDVVLSPPNIPLGFQE